VYGDYYFIEALKRCAEIYSHTTLTYIPNPGFQGTDTFGYQLCDSAGNCATATVTVVVEPSVPNPFAAEVSVSPVTGFPVVSFPSTAGRVYDIQYRPDVSPGTPWQPLANNLAGSGLVMSVSDTNPALSGFYRVAVEALPAPPQDITLQATQGAVTSPFVLTNGYLYQPAQTALSNGGRAVYTFTVTSGGNYVIRSTVNAPDSASNSFYLNIDAEPQDPQMIWDIPVTTGFEQRVASWRGNGTADNDQFVPKVFSLTPGAHQLVVRGREAGTLLLNMTITAYP
jgi:hypothetical protein